MPRDQIYPYALTTLQRVKDRIFDTSAQIAVTGTLASTVTISGVTVPSNSVPPGITPGQAIYGTGIPFGTYITAYNSVAATITLSQAATLSQAGASLSILNQQTAFDNLLIRMINSATDWVEREVGGRRFLQTLRTNEIYSAYGSNQKYVVAKNSPINVFILSGNTIANSAVVTGIVSTAGLQPNMPVLGDNIIMNTYIVSVDSSTQITLSTPASTTVTGAFIQASGLITFAWRAGTPSSPSWTPFIPDQYEVVDDGKAGIIRIYGVFPRLYNNMIRLTYWSGFLINWEYAGDGVRHTLPTDLSNTVENLVVRVFKRRQLAGKGSEALEGATTSWNTSIDSEDEDVLGHYRQIPMIF